MHGLFRLPDLADLPGVASVDSPDQQHLSATYLDTVDLRLVRAGITLRRRTGGIDSGWHLKLPRPLPPVTQAHRGSGPAPELSRDELRMPLDSSAGPMAPVELVDLVQGWTRGTPLIEVATLDTERTAHRLRDDTGTGLAEVVDDSVSVVDQGRVAVRFRELEVELLAPAESPSYPTAARVRTEVVERLVQAGAIPGGLGSKLARALGPRALAGPEIPGPRPVAPHDPAALVVAELITRQTSALLRWDLGVRRGSEDAVHQMRVAARRLRSGLRAFPRLIDDEWALAREAELAWLAGELGPARDAEVLLDRLVSAAAALGEPESTLASALVGKRLGEAGDRHAAAARASVRDPRYLAMLDALVVASGDPPTTAAAAGPAAAVLPRLVAHAWQSLAKQVARLGPKAPDEQWHRARIQAKRARYAVDAVAEVFGDPARELATGLARITDVLGEHQDAVVAAETCRELAASPRVGGRTGFALGRLHAGQRAAAQSARQELVRVWPEVSRPRLRQWMG